MVDWNNINVEDYLVRRLKGNPTTRKIIDAAKIGNNFIVGEGSELRGPVKPNFTVGQSGGTIYHNVPTRNFPAVVKSNVPAKPIKVIPKTNTNFNAIKEGLDILYGTAKDTAEDFASVAKTGKPVNAAPRWSSVLPIVGNAWDINRGINQAFDGHPIVGTTQALLGAGGLTTLGAGNIIKKGAMKYGGKQAARKAINAVNAAKKFYLNPKVATAQAVIPELFYMTGKGNGTSSINEEAVNDLTSEAGTNKGTTLPQQRKNVPNQYPSGPSGSVESFLNSYYGNNVPYGQEGDEQQLQGLPNIDGNQVGGGVNLNLIQGQQPQQNGMTMEQLLDWYTSRMGTDPEASNIKAYADKYKSLQRDAYNRDLFHAALAGLSENPQYGRLIGRYNPAEMEATEMDLRNKSLQTEQDRYDKLNELVGNATIAGQLGLPLEAALANKNLLNTYTNLNKAQYGLYGKMYGADTSANAKRDVANILVNGKERVSKLDNAMKMAIAQENWQNARELQKMKDDTKVQVAQITGLPWAELDQYFGGMNALGITNIDTSQFGNVDNLFK